MTDAVQIIQTVGYPIAVSLILMGYIYQQTKSHKEETKAFTEALNSNTMVLESLKEKLDEVIK